MTRDKRMNLVMSEEEYIALARIAKEEMRSMSSLIRVAIKEYIKAKG